MIKPVKQRGADYVKLVKLGGKPFLATGNELYAVESIDRIDFNDCDGCVVIYVKGQKPGIHFNEKESHTIRTLIMSDD